MTGEREHSLQGWTEQQPNYGNTQRTAKPLCLLLLLTPGLTHVPFTFVLEPFVADCNEDAHQRVS